MLILRDMIESDIEDYVRWFTVETEWSNWDAPWESIEDGTEEKQREIWTKYYQKVRSLPEDRRRWKFEIEADGVHIGWVSAYTDLGYLENEEGLPAIGIDIPRTEVRGRGLGTQALKAFIDYFRSHGYRSIYTQTWSGNLRMVRVADKLGFTEVCRKKDMREVNGKKYDAITWRLDFDKEKTIQRSTKMKYSIITKGMGCPHCIKKVTKAMETLGADIEKVELNDIAVSSDKTEADIRAAIEALGFEVVSIKGEISMAFGLEDYEKRAAKLVDHRRYAEGDTEAKKALMREILRFTNDYFGMSTELFFTMPEGFEAAQGLTDPDTGNIRVNAALFDDGAPFLPLFIFLHELRHAIQKARVELFSKEIAVNCSHLIQFDGTGYLVDGDTVITVKLDGEQAFYTELYLGSPVETDANDFAYRLLRPLCDDAALEEHYRIWTPSYTLIPKENMLAEFMKAAEKIDRLAEEKRANKA